MCVWGVKNLQLRLPIDGCILKGVGQQNGSESLLDKGGGIGQGGRGFGR